MTEPTERRAPIEPDAGLVARIAASGDRVALAELAVRHGKTLYAVAYSVLFDPECADEAVRATFREVARSARLFDARRRSAQRWLVDLVRRIATGSGLADESPPEHLRHPAPPRHFDTRRVAHYEGRSSSRLRSGA
jgi:hypothetical protein